MRALLLALLVACGPKVSTMPPTFDEDLSEKSAPAPVDEMTMERQVAPPGKGMRTGTITRDRLIAVLDAGPAAFLRQFEVNAKMHGDRFVGWELVQLTGKQPQQNMLYDIDLAPGDVLLAINGKSISRPDQLQTVWDSLRTSNEVIAQLWRGPTKLELKFVVEPALTPAQ